MDGIPAMILTRAAARANGLQLSPLDDSSRAALRSFLPAAAIVGNPGDMLASPPPGHYERAPGAILRDRRVDSVIVIFIPPLVTDAAAAAAAIVRGTSGPHGKPVLGVFMRAEGAPGRERVRRGRRVEY